MVDCAAAGGNDQVPECTKGDKGSAEWMPPAEDATCTYLADWVTTKLRWSLTIDTAERGTLRELAASCADTTVNYQPATATRAGS